MDEDAAVDDSSQHLPEPGERVVIGNPKKGLPLAFIHWISESPPIWLAAFLIGMSAGAAAYLLILVNFLSLSQYFPAFLVITTFTILAARCIILRLILPRMAAHTMPGRVALLVLALVGGAIIVVGSPHGMWVEMANKLFFPNAYMQRALMRETHLTLSATGKSNSAASGSEVVLNYVTTQNGDISYQAFDYQGDWIKSERSLTTSGEHPAVLTWRGRPGSHASLVFQTSPRGGLVTLTWQDQNKMVDLYSPTEGEIAVDLDFQVRLYGYAWVLIGIWLWTLAAFPMLLLFIFLQRRDAFNTRRFIAVGSFFLAYLAIGMIAYQDYGISWDEPVQRRHGLVSAKYVLQQINPEFTLDAFANIPDLPTYRSRNYGVAFTLPLSLTDVLIEFEDTRNLWLFRHYATFLLFFLGAAALFKILDEKHKNEWLALLGTSIYVLSPRIFAESFYNVKDTAFLAAFTIALLFAQRFWRTPTVWNGIFFGITAAYATNIRIVTVLLIGLGLVYTALRAESVRPVWRGALALGLSYTACVFLFWPASWESPLQLFGESVGVFSKFDYTHANAMYRGVLYSVKNVPIDYIPGWIAVTTPLAYIIFFLVGAGVTVVRAMRRIHQVFKEETGEDLVFLAIVVVPVLAAIVMQSTLYNGWRHFFFIYSSFIILLICGMVYVVKEAIPRIRTPFRQIASALVVIWIGGTLLLTGRWMVINHPYQMTFFSKPMVTLFGGGQNFERDYWGLSLRQGLEHILAQDGRKTITYITEGGTTLHSEILTRSARDRLVLLTGIEQNPDFILRIYRNPLNEFPFPIAFEITVDDLPILTVYAIPK